QIMSMPAPSPPRVALNGLARKLVEGGAIDIDRITAAQKQAGKDKVPLIRYLVEHDVVDSRTIATTASQGFGLPLFDLDAMDLEVCAFKQVDQKLVVKHHALPLFRRGTRMFVALSDPTN